MTFTSETRPLLSESSSTNVFSGGSYRYSLEQKRILVAMVSICGLLPLVIPGVFIPAIPQIAEDLNSTGPIIGLAVSLSVFSASLGGLLSSSYSTFYGRRPVYVWTLPLLTFASVGVASSTTVAQLMFWRVLQVLGASPGVLVGAAVIGDIYELEERGQVLGNFFAITLLGSALAPFAGGLAARYLSWRIMQLLLGAYGLAAFLLTYFGFPETSHPGTRGVDKLERIEHPTWRPVILNPLSPFTLLRRNLLMVCLAEFSISFSNYVLLTPLAYTIGARYGITNEAFIGACFLPAGFGEIIGSPLAGRISDTIVVQWKTRRGGVWYPEDRLRATLAGALVFAPLSVLASGLLVRYVSGKLGLFLNLICLFINGVGLDMVLTPGAAYIVDILPDRSAEGMAANIGFRAILLSIFVAGIIPMVEEYGVVVTNTLSAILAWFGFGLLWLLVRYGDRLRAS